MSKFKVGDKVRRNITSTFSPEFVKGTICTVKELVDGGRWIHVQEYPDKAPWSESYFDFVAEESELERLVRVANEGLVAIIHLRQDYPKQIVSHRENHLRSYETRRIDIKPAPIFESFYIGNGPGWQVDIRQGRLMIGCKDFSTVVTREYLRSALGGGNVPLYQETLDFRIGRHGISLNQDTVSWADCDKVLAALEKYFEGNGK